MKAIFASALLGVALSVRIASKESMTNNPLDKVVDLLEDMQKQLQRDGNADEAAHAKFKCYCDKNTQQKTEAIENAQAAIEQLTATINSNAAKIGKTEVEIKNLKESIASGEESLTQAQALRDEEAANMHQEDVEMAAAIESLKAAVVILQKHHPEGIEGTVENDRWETEGGGDAALLSVKKLMNDEMDKFHGILKMAISDDDLKKANAAFLQSKAKTRGVGEILGVLKQMLQSFEENRSEAAQEEAQKKTAFEELKATKQEQIKNDRDELVEKKERLGNASQAKAQASEDLTDTEASLAADRAFLTDLGVKCQQMENEADQRKAERLAEQEAVGQAIRILTADDTRANFHNVFTPEEFIQMNERLSGNSPVSFIQTGDARSEAEAVLKKAADKSGNKAIALLASSVALDSFEVVKEAIDKMILALKKEGRDEVQLKAYCIEKLNENALDNGATDNDLQVTTAEIARLNAEIGKLTSEIEQINAEITQNKEAIEEAGGDRAAANAAFQQASTDQQKACDAIKEAMTVLRDFYGSKQHRREKVELPGQESEDGPGGFDDHQRQTPKVIQVLQTVYTDAKSLLAQTKADENAAQSTYEDLVQRTNASIDALDAKLTAKTDAKGGNEIDKTDKETLEGNLQASLESLEGTSTDLHAECDFTLKNFDISQQARQNEVDALHTAKQFLNGMKAPGDL